MECLNSSTWRRSVHQRLRWPRTSEGRAYRDLFVHKVALLAFLESSTTRHWRSGRQLTCIWASEACSRVRPWRSYHRRSRYPRELGQTFVWVPLGIRTSSLNFIFRLGLHSIGLAWLVPPWGYPSGWPCSTQGTACPGWACLQWESCSGGSHRRRAWTYLF